MIRLPSGKSVFPYCQREDSFSWLVSLKVSPAVLWRRLPHALFVFCLGSTIRPNTNCLFGPLFGAKANTKRIFSTALVIIIIIVIAVNIAWVCLPTICRSFTWHGQLILSVVGRPRTHLFFTVMIACFLWNINWLLLHAFQEEADIDPCTPCNRKFFSFLYFVNLLTVYCRNFKTCFNTVDGDYLV